MNLGIVGLGKMGLAVAWRLLKAGHKVIGHDLNESAVTDLQEIGGLKARSLADLAQQVDIVWLMVPAGKPVDDTLGALTPNLRSGSIIIDGGNSNFSDSIKHYNDLKKMSLHFIDCGTSGGIHGKDFGFSLMIGGDHTAFIAAEPIFKALAMDQGYAHLGPSGAGHYVKMVHNGIEYALLQAYAEGFHVLKNGSYDNFDLEKICSVWNSGSIVRSWIVELARQVFEKDQTFTNVSGHIFENKTGQWMIEEARERNIPVKTIMQSLDIRAWSRATGGNYATKIVAMLRQQFGGHPIKKPDDV